MRRREKGEGGGGGECLPEAKVSRKLGMLSMQSHVLCTCVLRLYLNSM